MGLVHVTIRLTNTGDLTLAQRNLMPAHQVRSVQVLACVDTGAVNLCVTQEVADRLGLRVLTEQSARLANDSAVRVKITEPVDIEYGDRSTTVRASVVPGATENLLGAIPLEDMDLMIHPAQQALVPAHPEGPVKPIKRF